MEVHEVPKAPEACPEADQDPRGLRPPTMKDWTERAWRHLLTEHKMYARLGGRRALWQCMSAETVLPLLMLELEDAEEGPEPIGEDKLPSMVTDSVVIPLMNSVFGPQVEGDAMRRMRGVPPQQRAGRASFLEYTARFQAEHDFVQHALGEGLEKELQRLYVSGLKPSSLRDQLVMREYPDMLTLRRTAKKLVAARDSAYELLGTQAQEQRANGRRPSRGRQLDTPPVLPASQASASSQSKGEAQSSGEHGNGTRPTASAGSRAASGASQPPAPRQGETRTCHKCGEVGHISPHCPTYPKGVPGPYKRPGLRSAEPAPAAALHRLELCARLEDAPAIDLLEPRVPLTAKTEDGTLQLNALLDTGSRENYISTALAAELTAAGVFSRRIDRTLLMGDQSKTKLNTEYLIDVTLEVYVPHPVTFRIAAAELPCADDLILGTTTMSETGLLRLLAGPAQPHVSVDQVGDLPEDLAAADVPHNDPEHHERCARILVQYPDVVRDEITREPARTEPYGIQLKGPLPAKPRKLRRETPPKRAALQEFIETNLELGIIRPSTSPVCADLVFARKTPTTYRVVVDFTKLNQVTQPVHYPLCHLKDLLAQVAGHSFYAILDLKSGFHQIPMKEDDMYLTSFWCSMGQYEFCRLPEGLRNASSFFQRQMTIILGPLVGTVCYVFVDDVLVFADDEATYFLNVTLVLDCMREHHLVVSKKKVKLGMIKIEYLGHIVSAAGLELSDTRKQGILQMAAPSTLKGVLSFLGAVNYCRDFLSFDALEHLVVLQRLTRKGIAFRWGTEEQAAFAGVKDCILQAPLLHFPTDTGELIVRTDASDVGIGGFLIQREPDGNEHLILCLTRSFNDTERNWIIMEKELFAVLYTIKKCAHFLEGRYFTVEMDNKNLMYAASSDSSKVIRWSADLREGFDFGVLHIAGSSNWWADYLSRYPPRRGTEASLAPPSATDRTNTLLALRAEATEHLPCLRGVHNHLVGHVGEDAMALRLSELGHEWPGRAMDIKAFIQSCPQCQINRLPMPRITPAIRTTEAHSLWDIVAVDTCKVNDGFVHTFRCCFSGWTELAVAEDGTAASVAVNLLWLFGRYGCPHRIRSDNGREFVNALITAFLRKLRVDRQLTLEYHPASNGIVERANGLFLGHLRAILFELNGEADWRTYLPLAMRIVNSFPYTRTGMTPAQAMFGARLNINRRLFDHTLPDEQEAGEDSDSESAAEADEPWLQRMDTIEAVLLRTAGRRLQQAVAERRGGAPPDPTSYDPGTPVLVKPLARRAKLTRRMLGPRVVVEQINNIVTVRDLLDNSVHRYYVDRLKPYDDSRTEDLQVLAAGDTAEYVVDRIIAHEFRPSTSRAKRNLYLHTAWLGYSDTTWEPYYDNQDVGPMRDYVSQHQLLSQPAAGAASPPMSSHAPTLPPAPQPVSTASGRTVRPSSRLDL